MWKTKEIYFFNYRLAFYLLSPKMFGFSARIIYGDIELQIGWFGFDLWW